MSVKPTARLAALALILIASHFIATDANAAQPAPDAAPAAISVSTHIVTGSVAANGTPGPVKTSFTPQDARVCSFVQLTGRLGGQQLNWKYINPQGTVQMQANLNLPSNSNGAWSCLSIAGRAAAKLLGNWSVQLWIDGVLKFTDPFKIGSLADPDSIPPANGLQVVQHVMTRNVSRTPCCSVTATTSFLASDSRAISFVELKGDFQNKRLRWEFTDPRNYVMTVEADAKSRYHWAWISPSGRLASSVTGNWTVKFYINNQLQFTDSFVVTATSAAGLSKHSAGQVSLRPLTASPSRYLLNLAGQGIHEARLQIFDAQSRPVFDSGFSAHNSIIWNTLGAQSRPLANGLYFYIVTMRGPDGRLVASGIKKILVMR